MFIITQLWNPLSESILCTDGEWHTAKFVGPGGWTARTWKTEAGAIRFAAERWNGDHNRNLKTGVNAYPVTIRAAD